VLTKEPEKNGPTVFRLCQSCGRPTPAQSPECVNCGVSSLPAHVDYDNARAEQQFARAYFSRTTPVTFGILGLNLLIYLLMTLIAGGDVLKHLVFGVDSETLIAFGAKTNHLLTSEWFRLVTPIFIHAGLIHIGSNSYALWVVGPQVERLYGSVRFVLIYLLCGIGGVAGSFIGSSLLGRDPNVPSVGASGAIFGLFGVLLVFGYKYRHELPQAFRRAVGSSVLPVIAINLFIGFSIPVIDNGAHIGGLVCGALLALLIPYIAPGKERTSRVGVLILALSLMTVVISFVQAGRRSGTHLSRRASIVTPFLDGINEGRSVLGGSFRTTSDESTRARTAASLSETAQKLDSLQAPTQEAERLLRSFSLLLREQRAALEEPNPELRKARLNDNAGSLANLDTELKNWVAVEGASLGIVESTKPPR
jgi:membrane associated rhomboid family serine protease